MTRLASKDSGSVAAVLAAMALVVVDAGMTNVALPTMSQSLAVPPAQAVLVVTAYQLALVMALLPCAQLAERVGQRKLFVSGILLFTAASLLCAAAPTISLLVAARFVQGLGAAAIMALGIAILRLALDGGRFSKAIGWNATTVAACAAIGPLAGALMLGAGWRWLFIVNVPIGLAALILARALPDDGPTRATLDLQSIAMYAAAAILVVMAAQAAVSSPLSALGMAAASIACLSLLARRERPKRAPLVPFDLLRGRPFRLAAIGSVCCFTGQTAGLLSFPFHVQLGLGESAVTAALLVAFWPAGAIVTTSLASRLERRFTDEALCLIGGLILAMGLLAAAIAPGNGVPLLGLCAFLCGIGFGTFQVPNNRSLFLAAPADRSAAAGGVQGTARLAGQTAGAVLITLLFTVAGSEAPQLAMMVGSIFALTAAIISGVRAADRADTRLAG